MKNSFFILHLFFCTLIFAQNVETSIPLSQEYLDLISFVPSTFELDTTYVPDSKLIITELNSIGSLKLYNGFREEFKLSENDKKWIEDRIDKLAISFFKDGKRVLLTAVGGYSGCPEKMIDTIRMNDFNIVNLKFCHSCTDSFRDENFIEIFNKRMYSLLKIEPPNYKTRLFNGKFLGLDRNSAGIELILEKDRTFRFWRRESHGSDFTEGFWKNISDTLFLSSKTLLKQDSLVFSLSNAKWIKFDELKFRYKKDKLIELGKGKRKLNKLNK